MATWASADGPSRAGAVLRQTHWFGFSADVTRAIIAVAVSAGMCNALGSRKTYTKWNCEAAVKTKQITDLVECEKILWQRKYSITTAAASSLPLAPQAHEFLCCASPALSSRHSAARVSALVNQLKVANSQSARPPPGQRDAASRRSVGQLRLLSTGRLASSPSRPAKPARQAVQLHASKIAPMQSLQSMHLSRTLLWKKLGPQEIWKFSPIFGSCCRANGQTALQPLKISQMIPLVDVTKVSQHANIVISCSIQSIVCTGEINVLLVVGISSF